jgi:hypothetical protein
MTEMVKDFFTDAQINIKTLHNVLSEFLAVEKGGQKLYEKALTLVSDSEVRTKFRKFSKTDDQPSKNTHRSNRAVGR